MPSYHLIQETVTFPQGFLAGGVSCGLKPSKNPDIAILYSPAGAKCLGAFTQNRFRAAPVDVCVDIIESQAEVRGVIVNSGNANACTGAKGIEDAQYMSQKVAQLLQFDNESFAVCSTGVIGQKLDMSKVVSGMNDLSSRLSHEGGDAFSNAILTTDTCSKNWGTSIQTSKGEIRIGGCSKGAGMIHPDMATMLAFVTTDVELPSDFKAEFIQIVKDSFNSITVDGDTSTNDTVLMFDNGASGVKYKDLSLSEQGSFRSALFDVFVKLAQAIVKDGEGATRFVEIEVCGAVDKDTARKLGRFVANSKLVKTAMFGQDPNWGRLVASLGACGYEFDSSLVDLYLDHQALVIAGQPADTSYDILKEIVQKAEYKIRFDLHAGNSKASVWTCDLSYEYVRINAEYTT